MGLKIALFGGSFDPPTLAHREIAEACTKIADLTILVPAAQSPHKNRKPVDGHHRITMLHLATTGLEKIEVSDQEIKRPPPSHACDTITQIQREYPEGKILLIVGSDQYRTLPTWHNYERWKDTVEIVVAERDTLPLLPPPKGTLGTQLRMSSTQAREYLKKGENTNGILSPEVADYIHTHNLYKV